MKKTELIHIRIDPVTKRETEEIFDKLGVSMSYAVSMFLNQVRLRGGFPFEIELPEERTREEVLAEVIQSTAGKVSSSEFSKSIIHMYATGQIDYKTASSALKRSHMHE